MSDTSRPETMSAIGEGAPYAGVGQQLRAARIASGETLADVSAAIRVREVHLAAIEEGQFENLPGSTYATGFVRSYAEHLDLDPAEAIRRLTQETGGSEKQANKSYHFPEPIHESRAPSLMTLFVAILLSAMVYGGWYLVSLRNQPAPEIITDVPDHLRVPDPGTQAADNSEIVSSRRPERLDASDRPTQLGYYRLPDEVPVSHTAVSGDHGDEVSVTTAEDEAIGADNVDAEIATEPDIASQLVQADAIPADQLALDPGGVGVPRRKPGSAEPDTPMVEPREPANIELRAVADAWVQISSLDGAIIAARVLRTGEVYQVPERAGLALTVADASAIEILKDGEQLPPLGPRGAVIRNLSLEPDALAATQP